MALPALFLFACLKLLSVPVQRGTAEVCQEIGRGIACTGDSVKQTEEFRVDSFSFGAKSSYK